MQITGDQVGEKIVGEENVGEKINFDQKLGCDHATERSPQLSAIWQRALEELRAGCDSHLFAAYIEPLTLVAIRGNVASISSPSRFVSTYIEENFKERIAATLARSSKISGLQIVLDSQSPPQINGKSRPFVVRHPKSHKINGEAPWDARHNGFKVCAGKHSVNPAYTFDSFVVGNNNQFCHAASMLVAKQPGKNYNPLFIYGGVGLGKTHLLHAIGNAVLQRDSNAKVLYISSESFTNELILALRNSKMDEFKSRLRSIEVLLIDDIQFMCGKERTQEEFFHTFNALYGAHHQIVITSDKIPQDIPGLEERLQTRFAWGLTADLQAPDFETRVAILKRKATLDNIVLPEAVAHFIAEQISTNVRELEGALTRVFAMSSLQRTPVTLELAQNALQPLVQHRVKNVGINDIKKVVSNHFGIKVSEMISKRRTKSVSFPRHIAMYLCRKHTTASYPEIGQNFGGRDHSSVIHAAQVVSSKLQNDAGLRAVLEEIEKKLLLE